MASTGRGPGVQDVTGLTLCSCLPWLRVRHLDSGSGVLVAGKNRQQPLRMLGGLRAQAG